MSALVPLAARASTTTTISSSTTISGTPAASWHSASTKAGWFGAGYTATQSITSDTTGSSQGTSASNSVQLEVFGNSVQAGEVKGTTTSSAGATPNGNFQVSFLGGSATSWSDALSASQLTIQKCFDVLSKSTTVDVAGIPVTVKIADSECTGINVTGAASSAGGKTGMTVVLTPTEQNSLSASGGIGVSGFSAGAEIDLDLFTLEMPITQSFTVASGVWNYTINGVLDLSTLSGYLGVYVQAAFIKYTYELISWSGVTLASVVLFSDSIPVASDVGTLVYANQAKGNYAYYDAGGLTDQSIYAWYRASDSSGTGSTLIDTAQNHNLVDADNTTYLEFCVTPYNGANKGTQECSSWTYVGALLQLYKDENYSNTEFIFAYQTPRAGTCINLSDYSFNGMTSSYKFNAPLSKSATVIFYSGSNCSGSTLTATASAATTTTQSDLKTVSFNDEAASFGVDFGDQVTVSNVGVSFSENYAVATYTFDSENDLAESGSQYWWYWEAFLSGDGEKELSTGSTEYALQAGDSDGYLQFCIAPSDGYQSTTTGRTCSAWTPVNDLIGLYQNADQGGNSIFIPYESVGASGTCVTISGNFYHTLSSYVATDVKGLNFFTGDNCTGSELSTDKQVSDNMKTDFGKSWNDTVASLQVIY